LNNGWFFVRLQSEDDLAEVLAEINQLPGYISDSFVDDGKILLLHFSSDDPRSTWRQLSRLMPAGDRVFPVIFDRNENPLYPTGELVVRFIASPSEGEIQIFAERHNLKFLRVNPWIDSQVVFIQDDPSSNFILDVLTELERASGVQAAWLQTEAKYDRLSG
jgi:hypothetical protein